MPATPIHAPEFAKEDGSAPQFSCRKSKVTLLSWRPMPDNPELAESEAERFLREGSGPWADLALTLPLFIGYHLGVVFLPVRNAADVVTRELTSLAENDLWAYISQFDKDGKTR